MQSEQVKLISPVAALNKLTATDSYVLSETTVNPSKSLVGDYVTENSLMLLDNTEPASFDVNKSQRQGMRLSNYNLMVKFEDGNQISEVPVIYPLPNSPDWFLGMSNLNGQTIPVFNLKKYFNLKETKKELEIGNRPMLFVIQQGENATGIIIDKLLERLDLNTSNIQHNISLPTNLQGCVKNTYLLNKEIWYDLNSLLFLDRLEKQLAG